MDGPELTRSGFTVTLRAVRSHLDMELSDGERTCRIRAINISDFLTDLVRTLADVADGALLGACLWLTEPWGSFIDIARNSHLRCSLVVTSIAEGDWTDPGWLPLRGEVLFTANRPLAVLLHAFDEALVELERGLDVSRHWGLPFPEQECERLRTVLRAMRES